jgi:hypothetical protein
MSQNDIGAWRRSAINAVMALDVQGSGPLELVEREADAAVEAVLDRVVAALENEYAPQLHQTAHPADAITKLFKLTGHEGIRLRRTYDG